MIWIGLVLSLGLFLGGAERVAAAELVHQFINPSFGGSPFNGQPLLNSAILQNQFGDAAAAAAAFTPRSPLEDFQSRLDRAILSQLSRQIVDSIFGEEVDVPEGTFDTGDFLIEITEDLDGVTIAILDQVTGDSTTVQVPFF